MRETAESLRKFFYFYPVILLMNAGKGFPGLLRAEIGSIVAVLVPLGFAVAYGYVAFRLPTFLVSAPGRIRAVIMVGAAGSALAFVVSLADSDVGGLMVNGVQLLINWYLLRNVNRLAAQAAPPTLPSVTQGGLIRGTLRFRMSRTTRDVLLGKFLLILAAGALLGYLHHQSIRAGNNRAQTITLEEYTAGFETFKQGLVQEKRSLWGDLLLVTISAVLFFAVYEGLGRAVGWLVAKLLPPSIAEASPSG